MIGRDDIKFIQYLLKNAAKENELKMLNNSKDLEKFDNHKTEQEDKRDKQITELLTQYVYSCKDKFRFKRIYKEKIFKLCQNAIFLLIAFMFYISYFLVKNSEGINMIISFVSVCATFVGSFLGILNIITKYIFPTNDEKYITEIVQLIQNNDLANKKENLNHLLQERVFQLKEKEELKQEAKLRGMTLNGYIISILISRNTTGGKIYEHKI